MRPLSFKPSADLAPEVRRVCGYIADDRYIASYYGVSVQFVRQQRRLQKVESASEVRGTRKVGEPLGGNTVERDAEVRCATEELRFRIFKMFDRVARERGISIEAAARALLTRQPSTKGNLHV